DILSFFSPFSSPTDILIRIIRQFNPQIGEKVVLFLLISDFLHKFPAQDNNQNQKWKSCQKRDQPLPIPTLRYTDI
ncbi:MAG: hypothetical protein K2P28_09715, partial [Lachnospiraceae bacterium]|nr:hypothetical protein [Lachnospiraceae bacterium]